MTKTFEHGFDFTKIGSQVMDVLEYFDIAYDSSVVREEIVPAWYEAKKPLLEVFSKHPNWDNEAVGVVFNTKYERPINYYDARSAFIDVEVTGAQLPQAFNMEYADYCVKLFNGTQDGDKPERNVFVPKITPENYPVWESVCPADKDPKRFFPVGLRTSRAFDRFFKYYGRDKDGSNNYDHFFAKLADAVSPLTVTRTTCLSFHPCDYLLMSRGTGWHSCHLINGGGWQGGTWSYMLDNVSSIFYTTEDHEEDMYWNTKVNRMVTCFQDKEIFFSRLYPNYEDKELRTTFRNVIQEIYAQCLGIPNLWQKPMGYREYSEWKKNEYGSYVSHNDFERLILSGDGHMQYEDYDYECYNAQLSVAMGTEPTKMYIGTWGICPETGEQYSDHASMSSRPVWHCENCGEAIYDEDDVYYDNDGNGYCEYCFHELFTYCEDCNEYYRNEDTHDTIHGTYVCDRCFDRYYTECCECGLAVEQEDAIIDVDDNCYCDECANRRLTQCDECGEYFRRSRYTMHEVAGVRGSFRSLCDDCYEELTAEEEETEEVFENA